MLTQDDNRLLTETSAGTPGGDLLRRYWMPVGLEAELTEEKPKKRVRIMGENLVLFRDGNGRVGLIREQCAHRRASLYFGWVEEDGLRCPYHGWKFATTGKCVEQPFEPKGSPLKDEACVPSYPVESLCGIVFAYLGPLPAPLLPRWETMVSKQGTRSITVLPIHDCNWLQAQENSVDPVHTYYLHAHMLMHHPKVSQERKLSASYFHRPIQNIDFELTREEGWTGIRKIRTYGGSLAEREVGHPAIFPNILIVPQDRNEIVTHWRVPVDDTHTYIVWLHFAPTKDGSTVDQADVDIPIAYLSHPRAPDGEYDTSDFPQQDLMAWETQGPVYDRSQELLGTTDRGIVMWRNLLRQQIERVREGKEPDGMIHDAKTNQMISLNIEKHRQERFARELAAAK
ncbi:MAG TPA: Rieske 2Fe-2S domain-containing protein [Stellaceae bacterium]|jgi:5,5'-dehydrodivanillate O-demethylase|nr:Rieske 2Fe-2S domain-containing protein [Stellaceae bacterium]